MDHAESMLMLRWLGATRQSMLATRPDGGFAMKTANLAWLMGIAVLFVLSSCGDDEVCERGETQQCICPTGATGAQVCSSDLAG